MNTAVVSFKRSYWVVYGFMTFWLALCGYAGTGHAADATPMGTFSNYKDAWNNHDANLLASCFENGGTFFSPAAGQALSGPAIAGFTQGLFTAMPDIHVDVQSVDQFGNGMVVERWVVKGTWSQPFPAGPLAGKPATGKSFVLPGVSILEIKNGKIMNDTQYWDQLAFLSQIGAIGQ